MSQENPTILVIDDDAEIRYSLDRVLRNAGFRVQAADSGETGIEKAKAERPEVIFLDNRMNTYFLDIFGQEYRLKVEALVQRNHIRYECERGLTLQMLQQVVQIDHESISNHYINHL